MEDWEVEYISKGNTYTLTLLADSFEDAKKRFEDESDGETFINAYHTGRYIHLIYQGEIDEEMLRPYIGTKVKAVTRRNETYTGKLKLVGKYGFVLEDMTPEMHRCGPYGIFMDDDVWMLSTIREE